MNERNFPPMIPLPLKSRWSRRNWLQIEDDYVILPTGDTVTLPQGFIFDGASVPRILSALYSPVGILFAAARVHDYAIDNGQLVLNGQVRSVSSKEADLMFWWLARDNGVSKLNAYLAWVAVRLGSLLRKNK